MAYSKLITDYFFKKIFWNTISWTPLMIYFSYEVLLYYNKVKVSYYRSRLRHDVIKVDRFSNTDSLVKELSLFPIKVIVLRKQ